MLRVPVSALLAQLALRGHLATLPGAASVPPSRSNAHSCERKVTVAGPLVVGTFQVRHHGNVRHWGGPQQPLLVRGTKWSLPWR